MIERGNYIVPYFNNQLRLDKPPLTYWAQVASYHIFGENDFAARFPSAIAAALTAILIFAWGRRMGGEKLGWWAAIIFTLSLQTFVHAKAAVADMWLVLFVTLASWAGYELFQRPTPNAQRPTPNSERISGTSDRRGRFEIALVVDLLPFARARLSCQRPNRVDTAAGRRWLNHLHARLADVTALQVCGGILLMLVVVALWGIPALIQTHGEFFTVGIGRHVVTRSFMTLEGHGASSFGMYVLLLPFYFVTVFISFFPWSIKLPWLIRKLWRKERSRGRRPRLQRNSARYLSALGHRDHLRHLYSGQHEITALHAAGLSVACAFARAALALKERRSPEATTESRRSLFRTIAVATACVWIAVALVVPQIVARFFPAYQLFQVSRASLQPNMQFAAVEFQEPSLVWYFRSRVQGFLTPLKKRRAAEFMSAPDPRFIILPTPVAGELFANPPASWRFFTINGFNIAKGKRVDLTLVLKSRMSRI